MSVCDRIDAAIEKMELRGEAVRGIYLTDADHDLLAKAETRFWRKRLGLTAVIPLSYRGRLIFRSPRRSSIYSTHGVETVIPQRLSPRVRVAA